MKAKLAAQKKPTPATATGAGKAKRHNIRAEIDRQLAEVKRRRTGRRGAAIPAPIKPAAPGAGPAERRGPGRPRTAPAGEYRPPRRSPGRTARAAAIAGVKDVASLAALPFPALSIAEAAAVLGCSHMHVSNCIDSGELIAMNIGRPGGARACNRILKASLEAFIARRSGAAIPAEAGE